MTKLIIYALILIIGAFFYMYFNNSKGESYNDENSAKKKTAQDFTNVLNIKDNFLYTNDKFILTYIKINPISIDLMSSLEIENFTNKLTAELSGIDREFKMLAISRTVNVTPMTDYYKELFSSSIESKQKELLQEEIKTLNNYALSSKITERQFYIVISEKYIEGIERDFLRVANDFINRFRSAGVYSELLDDIEIKKLINSINNPSIVGIEEN